MTPDQAKAFWSALQEHGLLERCEQPMGAAGLAVALHGTDHQELSDTELAEAGVGLGFAVSPGDVSCIREMLVVAEQATSFGAANSEEPFEPFQMSFSRNPGGEIEAVVTMGGVTFDSHVLQGLDTQFAWDYQRVARECLENEE